MCEIHAQFRFYEELNDFLPTDQRKQTIDYHIDGHPGIKDPIEALGVPHSEVELIVVNGESVGFDYQLQDGDRVAVYPVFEALDVSPLVRLRDRSLRETRFILDVHLGKLARYLRLLGFDSLYRNDYDDPEIIATAIAEHRIILTRDRRLLFNSTVTHGYFIRATEAVQQTREVLQRLDLANSIHPFQRCIACNGLLEPVPKATILNRLPPRTQRDYEEFSQCTACKRVYWKGSHYDHMTQRIHELACHEKWAVSQP
ncbi:MAG: Mut7-C ubiquitin/RNAse domain-containing protein [Kiritimatiellae bacterium]|nr:Mut7-C ubiquitin/RNAse domain-containing protein [Kiritimatiellia bacterium]